MNFSTPLGVVSDRVSQIGARQNDIAWGMHGKGMGSLIGRWCLRCLALASSMDPLATHVAVWVKTVNRGAYAYAPQSP